MDCSITQNGMRVLTAKEGYVITQKYVEDELERVYSGQIYLGIYDDESNWIEIKNDVEDEYDNYE